MWNTKELKAPKDKETFLILNVELDSRFHLDPLRCSLSPLGFLYPPENPKFSDLFLASQEMGYYFVQQQQEGIIPRMSPKITS